MTRPTFVWIVTRDGNMHATEPPILASGQLVLCGGSYGRRDLRVCPPNTTGLIPERACVHCRAHILAAGSPRGSSVS